MAIILNGTTGITSPLYQAPNCIYENAQLITTSYTMTTGNNGMSAGNITIDTGVTVTIPTGSFWTIV